MERDVSDRIRERAYELWAESGYCDGQAEQNWLAAEAEILTAAARAASLPQQPAKQRAPQRRKQAARTKL